MTCGQMAFFAVHSGHICNTADKVTKKQNSKYCRTHNVRVCLYIAYIAFGSASLYIKSLYFFLTVLALSAAATVANIKIRYDAKTPQLAIFGTRVIYVFYSVIMKKTLMMMLIAEKVTKKR